jgi:prevent-host-death family protein
MRRVNVHEAKTQLSRLLEEVEAGERIVIARAGKPIAILSAYERATRKRRLGQFAGQAEPAADFDQLPADIAAAFSGETP